MKKLYLLRLFPSLNETEIKVLPEELVVCWYPSSGRGTNQEILYDGCSGYPAVRHWKEQPSKLKPNFFIFSDIEAFEIPIQFDLIYSVATNIEKIKSQEYVEEKKSFDGTWLEGCDEILLGDQEENNKEILTLRHLTLLRYNDLFFLLVQAENEFVYERFIDENIKIPLLTLNRPMDPFIFDNGIDIEKLVIEEFIAGHSYVSSLIFGEEFKKYPDFVFGTIRREQGEHHDLANLYARLI
jgi:hypothetical protein